MSQRVLRFIHRHPLIGNLSSLLSALPRSRQIAGSGGWAAGSGDPGGARCDSPRLERLLQRVERGEPLQVCTELDLAVDPKCLARLQAKYEAGDRTWEALIDGRYGHPKKAHSALREWLYECKRQDEELTALQLVRFGFPCKILHKSRDCSPFWQ